MDRLAGRFPTDVRLYAPFQPVVSVHPDPFLTVYGSPVRMREREAAGKPDLGARHPERAVGSCTADDKRARNPTGEEREPLTGAHRALVHERGVP